MSIGSADASRVTPIVSVVESLCDRDSIESIATGETTPPMNPTFHGRGGGAALSVAVAHALASVTSGSSAFCTVRCGRTALRTRDAEWPPAPPSYWRCPESTRMFCSASRPRPAKPAPRLDPMPRRSRHVGRIRSAAGGRDAESDAGGVLARSHAPKRSAGSTRWERRNSFIRRNLDPLPPPSTVIQLDRLRQATYPSTADRRLACVEPLVKSPSGVTSWHILSTPFRSYWPMARSGR